MACCFSMIELINGDEVCQECFDDRCAECDDCGALDYQTNMGGTGGDHSEWLCDYCALDREKEDEAKQLSLVPEADRTPWAV